VIRPRCVQSESTCARARAGRPSPRCEPGLVRVALARATAIRPAKGAILAIELEALRVAADRDDFTLENARVDEQAPLSMLP